MITVLLHLGMNCICNLVASSYVTRAYSLLVHASFSFAHTLSRQLIYWSDHSLTSLTHSLTHSLVYPLVQSQLILLIFLHSWVFPGLDAYKQRKHGTSDAAQAEQTIPNTAASLALLVHSGHNLLAESPCSVQSRLKGTNPNHANCV